MKKKKKTVDVKSETYTQKADYKINQPVNTPASLTGCLLLSGCRADLIRRPAFSGRGEPIRSAAAAQSGWASVGLEWRGTAAEAASASGKRAEQQNDFFSSRGFCATNKRRKMPSGWRLKCWDLNSSLLADRQENSFLLLLQNNEGFRFRFLYVQKIKNKKKSQATEEEVQLRAASVPRTAPGGCFMLLEQFDAL